MKTKIIVLIVILVVLAAGAYLGRGLWAGRPAAGRPATGSPASGGAAANKKCETIYTCAMHPQIIRHHPGNCPICGMPLIKKVIPAAGRSEAGRSAAVIANVSGMQGMGNISSVALDPRERMLANVATSPVRKETMSQEMDTVGTIAVDEQGIRKISARYAGRIEKLDVNVTGQYVRKGQELFTIYSPEMVATENEYLIAKASEKRLSSSDFKEVASGTEGVLKAARTRMKLWGMTGAQIARLDRTGRVSDTVSVFSPVSGTVTNISARQGDYVSEGTEVFTVSDLSRVWMEADIYEYQLSKARIGSRVEVTTDAWPGKIFYGRVSFMDPSVNPQTRTIRVRADLNSRGLLKPDMFVTAKVFSPPVRGVFVPSSAVLYTGNGNVAWVEERPGVFTMRSITVGIQSGDDFQILAGLKPGEQVVTQGGFLIDSEAQLRASAQGMANMPGMNMSGAGQEKAQSPPAQKKQSMPGMNM